jgi:YbbR domain-containing protein
VQKLFRNITSMLIAIILATLVWVAAINEQNPPREDDYDQSISIELVPPTDGLITTDKLPETMRLRLRAPASSWEDLSPSKFKATLDLSKLPEGFNDVPIVVAISDPQVEIIEKRPQSVSINLQAEQVISLPVTVQIMDTPPLGYVNRIPKVEPETVIIKGPASVIEKVIDVVTEIYIGGSKETIERTSDVILHDRDGRQVDGLTLLPERVQVTVPVEQRFGYKDVSVRAVVVGQVAPGYRVSNISVDPPTITIVGNPTLLSDISGFIETAQIDLNQATESTVRTVPLNLPNGISVVSPDRENQQGPAGVQVTVNIAAIEDGIILQRPITQQGIDPAYWWKASPERADVFLSGPIPQLQSLKASDVEVIVDLFGLEPGVHKLKPTVFVPDNFRVDAILPDTVEVTIGSNLTPTPTIVPSPTSGILRSLNTPTPAGLAGTPQSQAR